jgi:hypothetical protein
MPFWYSRDDAPKFYSVPSLVQPVDFMNRQYFRLGVRVSCYVVLFAVVIELMRSYDGPCGLGWPGLSSAPQTCSFLDRVSFSFTLYFMVAIVYWPILLVILGILLIPPLIGHMIDRQREASV